MTRTPVEQSADAWRAGFPPLVVDACLVRGRSIQKAAREERERHSASRNLARLVRSHLRTVGPR